MRLTVASYNIQHGIHFPTYLESGNRPVLLDKISEFIKEKQADICGLNEIYGSGVHGNQPKKIGESLGFHHSFGKAIRIINGSYGNALVSRYPIKQSRVTEIKTDPKSIKPPKLYHEDRALLICEIEAEGVVLTVMTCHFGLNTEEAEAAVLAIKQAYAEINTPVILMGDFNITPDHRLIAELSKLFKDTACGDDMLTFPSNKPDRKIDYIFVSDGVEIESAWVEPGVISDHLPVFAKLKIK